MTSNLFSVNRQYCLSVESTVVTNLFCCFKFRAKINYMSVSLERNSNLHEHADSLKLNSAEDLVCGDNTCNGHGFCTILPTNKLHCDCIDSYIGDRCQST